MQVIARWYKSLENVATGNQFHRQLIKQVCDTYTLEIIASDKVIENM